jgi:hypothetical protein
VLEGHLVAEGGVNRAQAERLFSDEHLLQGDSLEPLLNLLAAEAWLAPWRRRSGPRPS